MPHKTVGVFDNAIGAAVVVFQTNGFRVGKVPAEVQDVLHFGTTPAVDGLIVVAHHANVLMALNKVFDKTKLNAVRVLIFVDLHMIKLRLMLLQDFRMFLKQSTGQQQQNDEINRT